MANMALGSAPSGGLPTLDIETLKAPERRITTVSQAKCLFETASQADTKSQQVRTMLQRELDGATPYDDDKLAKVGQKHRTNVNSSRMYIAMQKVMASLWDVINSNPTFIQVKTNYGNEATSKYWSDVLSREITKTVTEWSSFANRMGYLLHNFAFHGLGVAYFSDAQTWNFESGGLDEWLFPRGTKPESDDIEVGFTTRVMRVPQLMRLIEDEEEAEDIGWNVEAVKRLCALEPRTSPDPRRPFMEAERMAKNNDITYGDTVGTNIPVVHMFVQEIDGSISHAIFYRDTNNTLDTQESDTIKEFLYYKANAYDSLDQVMVLFPINTSTNGFIHALRGIGSALYPMTLTASRLTSQAVDASFVGMAMTITATDQSKLMQQPVMLMGNYTLVKPDVRLEKTATMNVDSAIGGTMSLIEQSINSQIGEIDLANDTQSRTEFEASLKIGNASRTTKVINDTLARHLTFLMREVVRRLIKPDMGKDVRGYKDVQKLIKRLERKGIPIEAFREIDVEETYANPAMGEGSPIQRKLALKELTEMMPLLPETGRNNLTRDRVVAMVGVNNADRYMPPVENPAPDAQQMKQAMLENGLMKQGDEIPVLSEEDHETHGQIHAQLIAQMLEEGNASKEAMGEVAPSLLVINAHLQEHLAFLEPIADTAPMYGQLKQISQQADELVNNGMKYLQAQQRKMQEQEQVPNVQDEYQQQVQALELENKNLKNESLKQELELKEQQAIMDSEKADIVASQNVPTNPFNYL